MKLNLTLKNITYLVITTIGIGWLLFIGSKIILPLLFASLFAAFLIPIDKRIQKVVKFHWLSILLCFLCVLTPLFFLGLLITYQFMEIADSLPSISSSLEKGADKAVSWLQNLIPTIDINPISFLKNNLSSSIDGPLNILSKSVQSSTSLLVATLLTFIYTFLFLLYKHSINNFVIFQFEKQFRPDLVDTLSKIKSTIQSYIGGLFLVIITLSIINSLGLWIIGINYPLFWGTLAGFLAIIPIIGTSLGGLLPFLYSLATYESPWQPIAIIIFYGMVQTLEGNIITPKIIGDKVNINPLFAILAMLTLGALWGIGGLILALPVISIVRIILSQFESTLPFAILMSSEIEDKAEKFKTLNNKSPS